MIYLDTSAFLKLYIREDGSDHVQATIESQDEPLPVVEVLQWEFFNAFRLKVFWGEMDDATVDHLLGLFDDRLRRGQYAVPDIDRARLTTDVREISRHTGTIGCRSLDVVHVAAALQLGVDRFVTFDDRQRALASTVGLSVA
ncbi:MAG: type II toxin-antitoxin system VapC family toxin [Spirochaeta sp.]|nr:type II toxin-antitoxin system VapC family toxin [Spirochaeta sp.]